MRVINVIGKGNISRKPDKAIISFQKISISKDYSEAIDNLNIVINQATKGLEKLGVKKELIKTSNFQVSIENKYDGNLKESVFSNYRAEHMVEIEIDNNNDEINKVLTFLSQNQFSANINIDFKISDIEVVREEVLIRAIQDAKEKGELIARSLGLKIAAINEVNYKNKFNFIKPGYNNILLAKSESIDFSIKPKDIEVEEFVEIIFAIK